MLATLLSYRFEGVEDMIIGVVALFLLHGADGREIRLNAHEVTRLHAAIPGQPNKEFTSGIKCLVFTTDGKVASVVESCEDVSRMIDKAISHA